MTRRKHRHAKIKQQLLNSGAHNLTYVPSTTPPNTPSFPAFQPATTGYTPPKSGTTYYAPTVTCWHDGDEVGNKVVWHYKDTDFVIADKYGVDNWDWFDDKGANPLNPDLILDLNKNISNKPFINSGPERFTSLNQYFKVPSEVVQFDWPDMTAPPAPLDFWERVLDTITANNKRVMITCHGGHGRSGTAMAALMVAAGYGGSQAINIVRARHCTKAVETKSQRDYLMRLAGEPIEVTPIKTNTVTTTVVNKVVDTTKVSDSTVSDSSVVDAATAVLESIKRPFEYCTQCARDFLEPSFEFDLCAECAEELNNDADTIELKEGWVAASGSSQNQNYFPDNNFWNDAA